jgi:hypothetical protein
MTINFKKTFLIGLGGLFFVAACTTLLMGLPSTVKAEVDPITELCNQLDVSGNPASSSAVCKANEQDKASGSDGGLISSNGIVMTILKLMSWLTGVISVLFLILGGIQFATSSGNGDKLKSAKSRITYALIGIVVILLTNLILRLIFSIANKSSGT